MSRIVEFVKGVGEWIDWQEAHRSREEVAGVVFGVGIVLVWTFICLF